MGILPLYDNMELQKTKQILNISEKFLVFLKKSNVLVKDIKNHFIFPYFRIYFNINYFKTMKKFKCFKSNQFFSENIFQNF